MKKLFLVLGLALVILIVLLGILSYRMKKAINSSLSGNASIVSDPFWIKQLSPKEQSFFDIPKSEASADAKNAYMDLIQKNGQTSDAIHITGECKPAPLVFSLNKNLNLKFQNSDTRSHLVVIDQQTSSVIKPDGIYNITLGSDKKGKILGYSCDNISPAGFFITSP